MRINPIPLMAASLLLTIAAFSQDAGRYALQMKSGTFTPAKNFTPEQINSFNRATTAQPLQVIIQCENILDENQKLQLKAAGIDIISYIPANAYIAIVNSSLDYTLLASCKTRAVLEMKPAYKMDPELSTGNFPAYAVKHAGTVDVWINIIPSASVETVINNLRQQNFDIISTQWKDYRIIALRTAGERLTELASIPFITYVQAAPPAEQLLNQSSRTFSHANVLNASAGIGRNLRGEGVNVAIGDDSDPQHVDMSGRKINRTHGFYNFHGTHVHGIAVGAGIWNELYTGHAPKASFVSQVLSGTIHNAPAYVSDYGTVITSNSWGVVAECTYHGAYDLYSSILDQQAISLPNLQHVFAAGNSGGTSCAPYPPFYGTVLGAHQSAKNSISVGNSQNTGIIWPGSSRGPVRDGRIKPEIVAQGAGVISTANFIDYWPNTGTSMATPSVSGGLALLYQRYRQLNGNANPLNGLMKAILCNTADDRGTAGPDYTYGFGSMNLLRAVQTIENNQYITGSVTNGGNASHNIVVPANTAALKVMLYWNDPAAAPAAAKALTNNLDLTVTTAVPAATYQPLILDFDPADVTLPAQPGIDTINNIEQVTINNPAANTYTVNISGFAVPVNAPQQYFIAYDIIPVSTTITYPVGSEKLMPDETHTIRWDSYGGTAETFTAEYSLNNGGSWTTISNSIAANLRQWDWTVPTGAATNQALVRITKNNTAQVSTSAAFTIIGAPALQLAPAAEQCEGYLKLNWTAVPNATQYEVMRLQGDEMVSVAIVSNATLSYTFSGLSKDSVYWVTTRAIYNGSPGRRDTAVIYQPNTGLCGLGISDNDIKMDAFVSPASSGRLSTSNALGAAVPLTVRIKNLDDAASTAQLTFSYSINGGGTVTDPPVTPTINPGDTYDYSFAAPINLSAAGTYSIEVTVVRTGGDPVTANNTVTKVFKQLDNPVVTLPNTEDFDLLPDQTVLGGQMGLLGSDRFDFISSASSGRLRTFINTGMAHSGTRAITLDVSTYLPNTVDSLTATYNMPLVNYNANNDDIRLDFRFKNHGQGPNSANQVWIRGSDMSPWLLAYDLGANQNPVKGGYKPTGSIQVSDILRNGTQNFSSSFQVRWGQIGTLSAADDEGYSGYTFDDIRLYEVTDDIQMVSIDTPIVNSCALSATTPVRVTIRNNSEQTIAAAPGTPVRYRINGSAWVNETIGIAIPANSNLQYTFTTTANLALPGSYIVEAEVVYPSDDFQDNDTVSNTVTNTPIIVVTNSNPYLQHFEADNGSWYTSGTNNSWEYGTPASYKINRAANGAKAWKTSKAGNYKDYESSYLYSPCFNISALSNPTLSLSIALDLEDCGPGLCDGAYVEYTNDGKTWARLGAEGQGVNWYNKAYAANNMWSVENYTRWHVATLPLSVLPAPLNQYSRLQFRFVVTADALVNREGIAIDDIHIYNNQYGIYETVGTSPVSSQPGVSGSGWVDFVDAGTNKIIASVNPDGQNLGNTDVQSFIYNSGTTAGVRINSDQYYHDRNITIKPANNTLSDSSTVRFYFTDKETDTLIFAQGCGTCYKPGMAYELGVSKYSDPNDFYEDGVVENGIAGVWLFINSGKVLKVPYDNGYYAQFRVKDFSEFWLNNGGFDKNHALPLELMSFTVRKAGNDRDAIADWITASEQNINRFELEVARGNEDFQRNNFSRLGFVNSQGNSTTEQRYRFTDAEPNKSGVRYYRLKIIENDGSFSYSAIRPVIFNKEVNWIVTPNPSAGIFNLAMQAADGELVTIRVMDASGKLIKQQTVKASGFLQKVQLDLSAASFPAGLYLLEAGNENGKQSFRLLKQ